MKTLRLPFAFLIILFILLGSTKTVPTTWAQAAIDSRFGAVEAFWAPNEASALGVGWDRILFYWDQIQPFGPNDWNTLHVQDEWLNQAQAQGRTVVGLLKNSPGWATDGPPASGVPRGLDLPIDDPGNLWARFTEKIASYYGARGVHHWIIWNEPDIAPDVYGHEFGGTTEQYYRLLKVAYQVIKRQDPSATIHLGGMTYWHDPGYLRRFLRVVTADPEAAANNYFFDVVTLHIYFRPETVPTIVGNAYAAQQEVGIFPLKQVWINETNARPSMDPEWPVQVQAFHLDLEQQAWFLVQAFSLGFNAGASRISVYKLVDVQLPPGGESWGLVRPHDFSKRPAYFAYQNLIKYVGGFTYPVKKEMTADYTIVSFPRQTGLTRVLWARNSAGTTLSVPAAAAAGLLVDPITDERVPVTPINGAYQIKLNGARCHQECLMGGPPVFLIEEGVITEAPPASALPTVAAPTAAPITTAVPLPTATDTPAAIPTATLAPTLTATPTNTAAPTATMTPTAARLPTETPTSEPTTEAEVASLAPTDEAASVQEVPVTPADTISLDPEGPTGAIGIGVLVGWGIAALAAVGAMLLVLRRRA